MFYFKNQKYCLLTKQANVKKPAIFYDELDLDILTISPKLSCCLKIILFFFQFLVLALVWFSLQQKFQGKMFGLKNFRVVNILEETQTNS